MKNQYSIDEILSAVKELNSSEKNKKQDIDKQIPKKKMSIYLITLLN